MSQLILMTDRTPMFDIAPMFAALKKQDYSNVMNGGEQLRSKLIHISRHSIALRIKVHLWRKCS
jgi:hypothetical protein